MIGGVLYLALIYLQPGQQDALRRYGNLALPVFRRHGGRFERILSPLRVAAKPADPADPADPDEPDEPDEIHLLRFETAEGLDGVRRDPEMAALGPLRREIVRKALLVRVEDVPLERYFKPG